MNAPIRYFGGKGTMFSNILEHFPDFNDIDTYIEPFGGSFSVGFKKPIVANEIYNDLEKNVYSLYKVLGDIELFDQFKHRCDLQPFCEDFRDEYREMLRGELSLLDRAYFYFMVNRMSFNGTGGFTANLVVRRGMSKSVSDFLSAIDKLPEVHQRLSRVIVMNSDGIELIKRYSKPNMFIYADPPYVQSTRTKVRYLVDMDDDIQNRFIDACIGNKSKILISGYDNELYRRLEENGFTKIEFTVTAMGGNMKPKEKVECLWKNY